MAVIATKAAATMQTLATFVILSHPRRGPFVSFNS
jgi:hypothetical protein